MNLLEYMLKFATAHPYVLLIVCTIILVTIFKGKKWGLLELRQWLWKTRKVPSHYDDKTNILNIDNNIRTSSEAYDMLGKVNELNQKGAGIYQKISDGTGKKPKKK